MKNRGAMRKLSFRLSGRASNIFLKLKAQFELKGGRDMFKIILHQLRANTAVVLSTLYMDAHFFAKPSINNFENR